MSALASCGLLLVLGLRALAEQNDDSSGKERFCLEKLADHLSRPVALEMIGEDVLIGEHRGKISRMNLHTGIVSDVVDLSGRLLTSQSWMDHRGLLSLLVVQTDDVEKPRRTLLLTSSRTSSNPEADHDTVISAIPFDENGKLDVEKEYELTRVSQPSNRYNGGQLLAQLDKGFLYLTTGDGAMKYQQSKRFDMDSSNGKILKMKIKLPSSSEADELASVRERSIFASGFRNPWRCALDTREVSRGRTQFFCGDTAIDPHPEEEIFLVRQGKRYGFPIAEAQADDEQAIYKYSLETGAAVVGGRVYKGNGLPSLNDTFLFGDYVSGKIFTLAEAPSGVWKANDLNASDWCSSSTPAKLHIVAFAENHYGDLLILADDASRDGSQKGMILKLRQISGASKPLSGYGKYIAIGLLFFFFQTVI
ncbi:HHIP-like protein 2 [Galendromus occidentalis]|uniref:HHIP-like protein 2 n=1 Tax=Galendromus occidentalis TaxID=34638 RepID=A0AAJ6QM41_9ACAR|nr:HHIP-like protein 2 [Galendromus occidentalis]